MKKLIGVFLSLMLGISCVGMTACNKETLIVYTEAGFAPWETTRGTEIVGVDIEIAQAIADELGWNLQIVNGNFDTIMAGINEDNALGIAGITKNAEREEVLEFSKTYATARQAILYKAGALTPDEETGEMPVSVFEGKRVGVQTGTTGNFAVDDHWEEWGIVKDSEASPARCYAQVSAAVLDMGTNIDYVIIDSLVAKQLADSDPTLEWAVIAGLELEEYAVAAKKGNTELIATVNEVLDRLLTKDDEGQTQIDKWVVEYSV